MQLITKEIGKRLAAADAEQARTGVTPDEIIAKFFTPWAGATWWVVQATPESDEGDVVEPEQAGDWRLYGFADLGMRDCAERGYTMLSQLQEINGPFGLKVERDIHFTGSLANVEAGYR